MKSLSRVIHRIGYSSYIAESFELRVMVAAMDYVAKHEY